MGRPLFGVDIAGLVAQHVAPGLRPVTITRMIDGERQPGNLTGGKAKTPRVFTGARGIWQDVPRTPPAGVTVELDDRVEKIGYKIREAQLQKVPYMLVIGDKEVNDGAVAVRHRSGGDLGSRPVADFVSAALDEANRREIK